MTELNIGALTDSTSYTGSVDTTNIFDLYKFNINSPGSFKFAIDSLNGNADVFLLNSSGATLYSSTNPGTSAEIISADSLVAGDYTLKVLQISGDIKYTLNLAPTSTKKSSDADILTGAKSDSPLPSNSVATSEKPTASKDVITGTPVDDKTVTAETTSPTTDKPASTDSETTLTSELEKPVAATESAVETTSPTTDKPATTDSETTLTSELEKPVAATESAVETTSTTTDESDKPATTDSETTLTSELEKPVAATESAVETTSTTTDESDKPVATVSETTLTPEPEKPVAASEAASEKLPSEETTSAGEIALDKPPTDSAISTSEEPSETVATNNPNSTAAAKTDAVAGETVATQEPKTDETLVAISPDASKPGDETNTDTSNGEETKKENSTTTVATTETKKEPEPTTDKKLISPFTSGVFTTDETGRISVDYTFDGGMFQGELAIFSLEDLDKFEPGSEAFIKEVAARSLSNSVKGHVVINDATEGARFSGLLGESNANEGVYLGVKSFAVNAGGKYGVILVPNGSVKSVFDNPTVGGDQRPLFSMAMANPVEGFHFGQIADITGEGNTFIMEDMRLDAGSDRDYNDLIFQVRGATAKAALLDTVINPDKEWRKTDLGKALIAYAKPYITPEPKPNVDAELSDLLDDLETEILNPSTSEPETPKTPASTTTTDKDTNDATQVETTDNVDTKPTTPAVTTEEEIKDTANKSGDSTQVETTDKVDAKPTTPAVTTEEEVKDTANNLSDLTQIETTDKVDAKPTNPLVTTEEEVKDAANNSGDPTQVETTDKVDAKPTTPAVTTEEEVKDTANNSGDPTQVETTDKVDKNPNTGATTTPTADKDTVAADLTEKLPVEKTPVSTPTTEVKDEVTEAPATATLPAKSTFETEVAATISTEKLEIKPEVLPAETLTKVEIKPEVLPAETLTKVEIKPEVLPPESKAKEESNPALVTEVEKTENTQVIVVVNPVESVNESQPTAAVESKETPAVVPSLAAQTMPVVGTNIAVESQKKEIVTQTENAGINDAAPKESLPIYPTVEKPTEDNSTAAVPEPIKEVAQNKNDVNADWIARLESIKQRLSNLGSADVVAENAIDRTLIARLETMTEKLREQTGSTPISDNTATLISRLEDMVVKVAPPAIAPVQFEFPKVAQPLVGIFNETGFSQDNPKIDYSRITLAKDKVEGDANPLVSVGEGNNPDTTALAILEAINKNAPLVVGRAPASSEEWAKSLIEYVDTAKASGQPNAIASINLNLTEVKKDGSITPRYELTQAERDALAYAQKHNVLVVVPAGEDPEIMSALGEISLEFDNIMTVGAAKRVNNSVAPAKAYDLANTSGSGYALDILADGSSGEIFNTAIAANKVAGAASQVWAANPKLSYRQVVNIIQRTATDLNTPNWDFETGSGLLNIPAAVNLAKVTPAIDTDVPIRWLDVDKKNQPLIGIIDTGFNGKNPDIDYKRIILGRDRVDNDNDPLLGGEGSEHGTHVLGIIGATQGNGIGIDGMNDDAPIWLGRAIGSGKWAESLREFVDAAKASGQPKAVVNLSFDLTQTNPDGSVTTRYELTPQERQAIEYARQNGVMIVVAAGNNGGTMSALGQASQEFDNLITVGSINYNGDRADYSSFGYGLDFVARGGTPNEQVLSTIGEGVNLKQMIGDEEPPEDEMSANARTTFEEVFGPFSDGKESENDEQELESLSPEERQVYDEAVEEIDKLLWDYLEDASVKFSLDLIDRHLAAGLDVTNQFVDAFDEELADNLIKAQEILEEAGFKTDTPTETNLDFSIPLDLGIGEMAGTSVAAAKVTGAVSQVWAANPGLSYFQVKEILKQTAVDLNKPGWDLETGSGLVNIAAAVELAKRIQPQAYQPKPIQSPLTWSGEGKVTPGERAVAVSVPTFTGRLMNAGYVTQTGWLRIRSGPGTNFAEVGLKYPGDATNFDAYEDNGVWVPDPFMPGGGSSRWYKIAGTNNWMSALYIDNTPERAEQERQQQDVIRRAEEEARRAEDEARRAEDEAHRAEEELRRIEEEERRKQEEEQRRFEEFMRQLAEEEERRKQEQFNALVNEVSQKFGDLGTALGSYVSNGVAVHHFANGSLYVQPGGEYAFYKIGGTTANLLGNVGKILPNSSGLNNSASRFNNFGVINEAYFSQTSYSNIWDKEKSRLFNWTHDELVDALKKGSVKISDVEVDYIKRDGKRFILNTRTSMALEEAGIPRSQWNIVNRSGQEFFENSLTDQLRRNKLANQQGKLNLPELEALKQKKPKPTGVTKQPTGVPKPPVSPSGTLAKNIAKGVGTAGKILRPIGFAMDAYRLYEAYKADGGQFGQNFQSTAGSVAGAWAGGVAGAWAGGQAGAAIGGFIGSIIPGAGTAAGVAVGGLIGAVVGGGIGAIVGSGAGEWLMNNGKTALNDALNAAKEKAKVALDKAKELSDKAKAKIEEAKATLQEAKAAYQNFKTEVHKVTTQIVQQSQQKLKEEAQKIVNKVVQNPVVQQGYKVVKQVAKYAQKASNVVNNIINGGKQLVNKVIDTGKQIVNNVIETGKKAYQEVKNFVVNTYETGKKVVTETYNKAAEAVNTVTNAISNGFNGLKSFFGR
ncbi:S8 family serine peptidase [Microcoleus sp. Pol14D5]|uniref:S8 family serine peptidase n=1 Tax=unclassified Microcoleus TaxID=2642155 RepID=UPI002FD24687